MSIFLLYGAVMLCALGILSLIIWMLPRLRGHLSNPVRHFRFLFLLGWVFGCGALIALVARDLDPVEPSLHLLAVTVIVGLATTAAAFALIRRGHAVPYGSLALVAALFLVTSGVHWLSDRKFTSRLQERTAGYRGQVSHLCLTVMDAARGDYYSCYGCPFPTTPCVDRLGSEGLRCSNAFSGSNWTPPGHISIFTGMYPPRHANDGLAHMPDELVSLTEILRDEGYYCVALYNNVLAGRFINLTQGFDCEYGVFLNTWCYPAPYRLWGKVLEGDHGASSTFPMAADLFDWVKARGGHLFLYINAMEPHAPYDIHEPYFSEFTRGLDIDKVGNMERIRWLCKKVVATTHDSTKFAGFTQESYDYLEAVYASEIAYTDRYIGLFADRLEETGLLDETLMVLTSDHGEFMGEHFTVGHPELLLNPVLVIPLIFRYPRLIEPRVLDGLTSNVDVLPTVLGLMGFEDRVPRNVDGIDVMGGVLPGRQVLSSRIRDRGGTHCLIQGRYKLFLSQNNEELHKHFPHEQLLFDLADNPEEALDRQADDEELGQELSARLQQWVGSILVRPKTEIEVEPEAIKKLRALGYL
jgi:arylsulfatase A-like enzyme